MENSRVFLTKVSGRNFKNYKKLETKISPTWTVLFGPNGSGKTNFLELLTVSLRGVNFRGKTVDLIKWGTDAAKLEVVISTDHKILTEINNSINSIVKKRTWDSLSSIPEGALPPLILFLPQEDQFLDSSSGRRKILGRGLLLQSERYYLAFLEFGRYLKQRNVLLRQTVWNKTFESELASWTRAIIPSAITIWKERQTFVDFLNKNLSKTLSDLGGLNIDIKVSLRCGGLEEAAELNEEKILERFELIKEKEKERRRTLIGPHCDRINFVHDGRDIVPNLSRGQRRLLLLALHFIEGQKASERFDSEPIFLLDDIFSELDETHRVAIYNALKSRQVIATTADASVRDFLKNELSLKVECGELT